MPGTALALAAKGVQRVVLKTKRNLPRQADSSKVELLASW
jgi:hypothetical protein